MLYFHLLSIHPEAHRLLNAEHDPILGTDYNKVAAKISESPHLPNQLPYTLAVIKETLRLYPPASITCSGEPGYSIPDPMGFNSLQIDFSYGQIRMLFNAMSITGRNQINSSQSVGLLMRETTYKPPKVPIVHLNSGRVIA
jgi:hypothetical protein